MMNRARIFCCVQAALSTFLGIQAVAVATIIMWLDGEHPGAGRFHIVRLTPPYDDKDEVRLEWHMGVDARVVVVVTLAIGATLQALALVLQHGRWVRALRWLEWSGCVPVTVMAVALEAGVRDVYAVEALFGLAWASQLFSFCADGMLQHAAVLVSSVPSPAPAPPTSNASPSQLHPPYSPRQQPPQHPQLWVTAVDPLMRSLRARAWLVPHASAWVMLLMAYAPIFNIIVARKSGFDDTVLLVWGQFVLACLGLVVQAAELGVGTTYVESPTAFETVFYSARKAEAKFKKQAAKPSSLFAFEFDDGGSGDIMSSDDDDDEDLEQQQPDDEDGGPPTGGVLLSYSRVDRLAHIFRRCNLLYTLLSFLSKTFLCWSVLGPFLIG
jgi:hypothetical protein